MMNMIKKEKMEIKIMKMMIRKKRNVKINNII